MGKKTDATRDKYELKKRSNDPSYRRIMGNYPAKKYNKGTPAITRLEFEMIGPGLQYIDIAKALSATNRRLYRQGCYYYVQSVEVYNNSDQKVDFFTLPDNWITRAAYRRAKGIWDMQHERILDVANGITAKYHDFKVYMDVSHKNTGSEQVNMYNLGGATTNLISDDWEYSQYVSADDDNDGTQQADNFYIHMIGPHSGLPTNWDSIGVIKSYADTRGRVQDSTPLLDADLQADPLVNLIDYSSEEQVNDLLDIIDDSDNEQPPYDSDVYVGELVNHHQHVGRAVTTTSTGRVAYLGGFCAPLGLIGVDPTGMEPTDDFRIVISLAEGTYHGVYAERMA